MYKILLFILLSTVATAQNLVRMATASSTDAYTAAFNPPLTSLNTATLYVVTFVNANTSTTVTLNPDGVVAATAIKDNAGNNPAVGAIVAGGTYALKFNGTNLRIAGSTSTGSSGSVSFSSAVLDVNTTTVGNVGAGEDVLWTYTLPGDSLSVDEQGLWIRVAGSSTVNGNNKRIKLKFGDDLMVDPGINNLTLTWSLDCQVIRVNGTTLKSNCQVVTIGSGQTHTVLDDITETLSGNVVIQLTGEGVADNDIIKESATVIRMEGGGGGGSGGGGSGDLSESDLVVSETPTGTVNGSNVTFTLANTPTSFVHVYLDGLLQVVGGGNDYTISGATITFVAAPLTGSRVRVSYIK